MAKLRPLKILILIALFFCAGGPAGIAKTPIILDTLEIKDMDINDVLKLFASKTGLNIIAGKSIAGRVTIFLQNVEVHDALTIILKSNDLAYLEDRGVVQIMTGSEYEQMTGRRFGVSMNSEVVPLQSLKATDVVILLSQLKSAGGRVIANEESNSVIIEETPEMLKKLRDYVQQIDVATQNAVYQLKFVGADVVAAKLQDVVTPKIGSVKFDLPTNKVFVKDTAPKLEEIAGIVAQMDIARTSRVYKISYAKAEDLAKTIAPLLTKDLGNLQYDTRSNTIIVTDIAPKITEISTVVTALDKNEKEVLIEAKIVQIELRDDMEMGINWETVLPNTQHRVVNLKSEFGIANVNPVGMSTIGTLDRDGYTVVMKMIATLGKSRLLSNPRIAVVNNQEARILVGTQTPYVTDSTTTPAAGPTTTAETVNFVDTGVKLHVTPTIHEDGFITMKIKPEVSNIPRSIVTSVNNEIPVVDTSEVETVVRVKDGVTIIIGGLIKDEMRSTKNKVPLLGDIPVLGAAFRNKTHNTDKSEIVIFLTPHIISGDVHVNTDKYEFTAEVNRAIDEVLAQRKNANQ